MMASRRGSLAWKLYAIGLVQLVLLVAVFWGIGRLLHPLPSPLTESHHRHPIITGIQTLFFGGLVIVGVGSLLTARWIVRPMQELERAARALGAGNLRARSGLSRTDEVGALARTFDEMAERIEQLVLTEKELLADVSHELRTPLARLRVALDIAGESLPEPARTSMMEMGLDLSELEAIVNDILTATRLELARGTGAAAHFELHQEEIDGNAFAERAADRFRARHAGRSVTVETEADPPFFQADPILLRRVIDNLLENAHKYSPDLAAPIVVRTARNGSMAFEVVDRGIGIAEKDLPHLFTPFFRGDTSRARATGGVGLGLALAKRVIDAHGGTIAVQSTLGDGTTVRVTIPTAPLSGPAVGAFA